MGELIFNPKNGELHEITSEKKISEGKFERISLFVSHDARDKQIAIEFCNLIDNVSLTMISTFCSSREGDIEYGEEWYKKIMKEIELSDDVICILTKQSVKKPWILYEAGVANGKFGQKKVIGLVIDLDVKKLASQGPFSQIQMCDCSKESLSKLVTQLLKKIPLGKPHTKEAHIYQHVSEFISII